ncbi:MAG TPA: hypothetical protein VK619_02420 [Pyrinomonadaceae bacterium]|nr:hypothetical protein [Pyrinomonadaceae bacterium]
MRRINAKQTLAMIGAVLIIPLFALALITGAHANALAQSGLDDLLLVGLALGGAIASLANGFGRRTVRACAVNDGRRSVRTRACSQRSSISALHF